MPSSPIRKLAPYAEAAKRNGVHVYHLNIGQPDIKTPECGMEALRGIDREILEYSPSDGYLSLRTKMVSYYAQYGIYLSPDEIIITSGGSEAVLFAFLACLSPGDEIIVTDPFYANYMAFAISVGAVIKSVKTSIEDGFRLPPVEAFEKQITPKTKAFSDEVYREFIYTGMPYISAFHLEGIEQNVVLFDSVSKRYSECGIRIGCLCTKNKMVHDAVMKFCQARLSPPLIGQIVAEASIGVQKSYLQGVYEEYLDRRNFLIDGLNRIPGVYSPIPMGAFYTVAKLPVDDAEKFCIWCLSDFQYEGSTIMMAPAAGFYTEPGEGKHEVRIAYILKKEDLGKALECLKVALQQYPGRLQD